MRARLIAGCWLPIPDSRFPIALISVVWLGFFPFLVATATITTAAITTTTTTYTPKLRLRLDNTNCWLSTRVNSRLQ
jgi:hypothetical protein